MVHLPVTVLTIRALTAKVAADHAPKAARPVTVHAATRTMVVAICDEKAHHAAMVRREKAKQANAIDAPTVLSVVKARLRTMAQEANVAHILRTVRHTRPVLAPIDHIRLADPTRRQTKKKATPSPPTPFDSLLLAPGPASLGPSQHGTGLLF
jgi:hypothetical protein